MGAGVVRDIRDGAGDRELARRAAAGDAGALEALYRRHVGRVYALALRMTADERTAEELTQDVWVRVWRKLDGYRGDAAFTTWLHRVTANLVKDRGRARSRRREHERLTDDPARHDTGESPRSFEDRAALEAAIRGLPERARHVFVLYDVEGYGHGEIAELLDIAEGTSKAHLHRARKALREELTA